MRRSITILALCLLTLPALLAVPAPAHAEETRLAVRVISKGAKFIGTSMGGVLVTVEDADTGEILARGEVRGSTGDTGRIMNEAHVRPRVLSTEGAGVFETVLDLERPRRLRVTALGPLAQRQAANEVSATQWVVPGRHVDGGDGLLLEMPGFAVDVLAPPSHVRLGGDPVAIEVNVTMMCGCPITPGGLWDADGYEVRAIVYGEGGEVARVPLEYAGSASQFAATWSPPGPGVYEAVVYAYDPSNGNTGLDRTTFIVR
ncbi:MAG: hypothetical protein PVG07_03800 [Acidobacteriota bacterium]|jgi:hypothetical protein